MKTSPFYRAWKNVTALNDIGNSKFFIKGRGFLYWGIWKMSFTFQTFTRIQGSKSIKTTRKANIWLYLSIPRHTVAGDYWKSKEQYRLLRVHGLSNYNI